MCQCNFLLEKQTSHTIYTAKRMKEEKGTRRTSPCISINLKGCCLSNFCCHAWNRFTFKGVFSITAVNCTNIKTRKTICEWLFVPISVVLIKNSKIVHLFVQSITYFKVADLRQIFHCVEDISNFYDWSDIFKVCL